MIAPAVGRKTMQILTPIRLIRSKNRTQRRLVRPTENSTFPSHRASTGSASSPSLIGARLFAVLCIKLIPSASLNESCSNSIHVRSPRNTQLVAPSEKTTTAVCAGREASAATIPERSKKFAATQIVAISRVVATSNLLRITLGLLFSFKGAIGIRAALGRSG